jgi:hypothetical protein
MAAGTLWGALTQLGSSAWQYAQGEKQKKAASNLKASNYLPPGVQEAIQRSRMDANSSVGPAARRGLERLGASSSARINNLTRMGGNPALIQQGVVDVDNREKEAIKDLSVSDAAYKANQESNLQQLLTLKGQYEKDSNDSLNASKSALVGASLQNKYNAITGAAEGIMYALPDSAFDAKRSGTAIPGPEGTSAAGSTGTGAASAMGGKYNGLTPEQFARLRAAGLLKGDSRFPQYNRFKTFDRGISQ